MQLKSSKEFCRALMMRRFPGIGYPFEACTAFTFIFNMKCMNLIRTGVVRTGSKNLMLGSRGWVLSGLETEVGSQGVMGEQGCNCPHGIPLMRIYAFRGGGYQSYSGLGNAHMP